MKRAYGHWKSHTNQRSFFDDLAKRFGITSAKDWGSVKRDDIIQNGGRGILNHYNRSLFRTLKSIYSGKRPK